MSIDPDNPTHKFVCVVGAGISGVVLGAEVHRQKVLKRPEEEMVIFESNGGYGGVWWNNTYPGGCYPV
jgi:cation diffusion facilitator CzcD-associated flavoprotein CzcO